MASVIIFGTCFALALAGVYATITLIQDEDKLRKAKRYYITLADKKVKPVVVVLYIAMATFMLVANYSFWFFIAAISVWKF